MAGLAVVIPAAPASPWLAPCVVSVLAQEPAAVYVVSEVAPQDVEARHVPVTPGSGFARRANAGLAAARADGHLRALLLNDDTELRDGALRGLAACDADIVGAVLEHWEGGVQQAGLSVSSRTARVVSRTRAPTNGDSGAPVDAVGGGALCVELELWERLGGFDERYEFYFEDVDFCLRARAAGARVVVVDGARVRHRGGGTRSHRSADAAFHLGRSHVLLARGLGRGPARLLRLGTVASAGAAWTLRSVGPAGLGPFVRGLIAGAKVA
jgi:GT2 family glycosyltransferase